MEFTEYTCPVCNKRFVNGDDVVVCPDCGAPHHRECWEKTERCFYAERHAAGFSFENAGSEETDSADNGGSDADDAASDADAAACLRLDTGGLLHG